MRRVSASSPLKMLLTKGLLPAGGDGTRFCARVLDYGCGQGADVLHLRGLGHDAVGYDPKWRPVKPEGRFDVVLCTFVLNVITAREASDVLEKIDGYLNQGGMAFVSVRRDVPREGVQGRDAWQRWVECPEGYDVVFEGTGFATFRRRK